METEPRVEPWTLDVHEVPTRSQFNSLVIPGFSFESPVWTIEPHDVPMSNVIEYFIYGHLNFDYSSPIVLHLMKNFVSERTIHHIATEFRIFMVQLCQTSTLSQVYKFDDVANNGVQHGGIHGKGIDSYMYFNEHHTEKFGQIRTPLIRFLCLKFNMDCRVVYRLHDAAPATPNLHVIDFASSGQRTPDNPKGFLTIVVEVSDDDGTSRHTPGLAQLSTKTYNGRPLPTKTHLDSTTPEMLRLLHWGVLPTNPHHMARVGDLPIMQDGFFQTIKYTPYTTRLINDTNMPSTIDHKVAEVWNSISESNFSNVVQFIQNSLLVANIKSDQVGFVFGKTLGSNQEPLQIHLNNPRCLVIVVLPTARFREYQVVDKRTKTIYALNQNYDLVVVKMNRILGLSPEFVWKHVDRPSRSENAIGALVEILWLHINLASLELPSSQQRKLFGFPKLPNNLVHLRKYFRASLLSGHFLGLHGSATEFLRQGTIHGPLDEHNTYKSNTPGFVSVMHHPKDTQTSSVSTASIQTNPDDVFVSASPHMVDTY